MSKGKGFDCQMLAAVAIAGCAVTLGADAAHKEGGFVIHTMEAADTVNVVGKVEFVANTITATNTLAWPSAMPASPRVYHWPQGDGSYAIYTSIEAAGKWSLVRCVTSDFKTYSVPQTVLEQPAGGIAWLKYDVMARRPDTGELLWMRWARGTTGHGAHFFRSNDGLTWQKLSPGAAYEDHDASGLFWDAAAQTYVVIQTTYISWNKPYPDNLPNVRRVLSIRTSNDGVAWIPSTKIGVGSPETKTNLNRVMKPDANDPPEMEFYWMTGLNYGDRYMGFVLNYAASPQNVNPWQKPWKPGLRVTPHGPQMDTEWWTADNPSDLEDWRRPYRNMPAGARGMRNLCDPAYVGDQMIWLSNGLVYALPVDRIAGVHSRANSEFSTKNFTAPAKPLLLNASAIWPGDKQSDQQRQAYIMVAVLGADGKVVSGYEKEKCVIQDADGIGLPLSWAGKNTAALSGQTIALRFCFRDATVYAVTTE